jgi:hypothetical protein
MRRLSRMPEVDLRRGRQVLRAQLHSYAKACGLDKGLQVDLVLRARTPVSGLLSSLRSRVPNSINPATSKVQAARQVGIISRHCAGNETTKASAVATFGGHRIRRPRPKAGKEDFVAKERW